MDRGEFMKKALVLVSLILASTFLIGCFGGNQEEPRPNIQLLVHESEVYASKDWAFEQFVDHAEEPRSEYAARLYITVASNHVLYPTVYLRTISFALGQVTQIRVEGANTLAMDDNENLSFIRHNSRMFPAWFENWVIDEVVTLRHAPMPNNVLDGNYIRLRIIRVPEAI